MTLNTFIRQTLVTLFLFISQPTYTSERWNNFVQETVYGMQPIPGWCSDEKAKCLMNLVHKHKLRMCIEIGVFCGKSLFPIARALQYRQKGKVFGIDAWDPVQATRGMKPSDPNFDFWINIDYNALFGHCKNTIHQSHLDLNCDVLKMNSQDAHSLFQDESIDFIHFDGNHGEECVLEDVMLYFPKIKNGGFIILNDPCWHSMRSALVYILERSNIIGSFESSSTYLVVQKDKIKAKKANDLMSRNTQ